ncbi:MAG TPA: MogA/MoaB family molybdenum cofactor biosynthesis protein [Planctomycetota bacterium]|nr:MogA/MoaB family molybdenum cofactor biosynthesis protein [Planctomycetota bacterium]
MITVSDTRTEADDAGGETARRELEAGGHWVVRRGIVRDDLHEIARAVQDSLDDPSVEAILLTGGTGVAPRDRTIEAVEPLLEKRLEGFGEIFRALSFLEIGSAAILSRALAGTARGRVLFALPGSPAAVALAVSRLISPEAGHILGELRRAPRSGERH